MSLNMQRVDNNTLFFLILILLSNSENAIVLDKLLFQLEED